MRVMDVHVHGVDLVSVIFQSTLAHEASPQASWSGDHQLQLAAIFAVSVGFVKPVLLPFLRQERDVFFSRTMHVQIRLLRRNVLFVVYNNCSDQQDPQIYRHLKAYGT